MKALSDILAGKIIWLIKFLTPRLIKRKGFNLAL